MSEEAVIKVGSSVYPVVKTGRDQAKQVIRLTKWLGKYGVDAYNSVQGRGFDDKMTTAQTIELILNAIAGLSEDALLELFSLATGCTVDESEKYFDVADLVDALALAYNEQPSIRRLVERFFLVSNSIEATEESSTMSEQPMDGMTKKS